MNDAVDPVSHQQQRLKIGRLGSIQVLRAVAVIFVLALHMSSQAVVVSGQAGFWNQAAARIAAFGHSGVDLFFVISGAVMYFVSTNADGPNRISKAAIFLIRRAFRIFPVFWISMAFAAYTSAQPLADTSLLKFMRGVLLIDSPDFHPVSWTLVI